MEDNVGPGEGDDATGADQADAAYRGFLFADLRGYTAFVERHGDAAAADLLDAYRELVRAEVARHAGGEVRTEGDSFYVVFGSARRAVACALAIIVAAGQASRDHPERPIRVGIGINAGESVQRGESFVGTAVNLAARVCAQAREGEVLVTAAVRDAIGASTDLEMVPRGTRRLKGIARPVVLYAVRPASGTATSLPSFVGRRWLPVAAVVMGVPLVVLFLWAVAMGMGQIADTSPSASVAGRSARSSAAPSASPSALATSSADPNVADADLLRVVGEEIAPHCEPSDEDDRPVLVVDAATAREFGITLAERIASHVGVACEIPGDAAPDVFHLWIPRQIIDFRSVDVGDVLILNRQGAQNIPLGDCADESPSYGPWQVGDIGGWFLCREDHGDTIIEWSYHDRALFGTAMRRDGDLAALLRWWNAEARLLRP